MDTRLVTIEAMPGPVTIDLSKSAALVVDMQNDFGSKGGMFVKMGFRPDLSDLGPPGSASRERHLGFSVGSEVIAPDGRRGGILIRDTWNTDVIDDLKPQPGDLEIYKSRFSGSHATEFDATLKSRGVNSLVATGCTTGVCVESTNHEASLLILQALFGWVSDSAALLRALT